MTIKNVTVLGSGTMGAGIAQVAATSGYETTVYDIEAGILDQAVEGIGRRLDRSVEKGRLAAEDARAARGRLTVTTDLDAALKTADYVIEAVPEKLDLKRSIFRRAEEVSKPDCILGTNTSTFMISSVAESLHDKSRLIGIHFFNPVPVMRLIEIVMGPDTSDTAYDLTVAIAKRMGKESVRVSESPGFTTSRINALIGNEAFRMLEENIATAEDIDTAMKLGLNHPMGPFEMVDLVGLDARLNNLRYLHETLGDCYKPSALLEKLVAEGRLGRKTGRGVYRYDADGKRI